jgi:ABC-type dipeptide/oligopeptide/nickel transport system permease component
MNLGTVTLSAVFVVLANLVIDLLDPLLDPRIVLR